MMCKYEGVGTSFNECGGVISVVESVRGELGPGDSRRRIVGHRLDFGLVSREEYYRDQCKPRGEAYRMLSGIELAVMRSSGGLVRGADRTKIIAMNFLTLEG